MCSEKVKAGCNTDVVTLGWLIFMFPFRVSVSRIGWLGYTNTGIPNNHHSSSCMILPLIEACHSVRENAKGDADRDNWQARTSEIPLPILVKERQLENLENFLIETSNDRSVRLEKNQVPYMHDLYRVLFHYFNVQTVQLTLTPLHVATWSLHAVQEYPKYPGQCPLFKNPPRKTHQPDCQNVVAQKVRDSHH